MIAFTIHAIDPERKRVSVTFHLDTPLRVRGLDRIEEERSDVRSNIGGLACDWTDEQDILRALREYAAANYPPKPKPVYGIIGRRMQ